MNAITEFLLARIADDESAARVAIDPHGSKSSPDGRWRFEDVAYQGEWPRNPEPYEDDDPELITWSVSRWALHTNRHSPARVLAECAAKRAIIGSRQSCAAMTAEEQEPGVKLVGAGMVQGLDVALKSLGAVYSDHPDYNPDWAL